METWLRFPFALALALSLAACSKPAADSSPLTAAIHGPRKISSVIGIVAGFLPARVVVCSPDTPPIPYLGPEAGSEGKNPLMMPMWLPESGEKLKLAPGDWIQFDLTIDWLQFNPLQIAPNLTRIERREGGGACGGGLAPRKDR
jgi:hypothetical protein